MTKADRRAHVEAWIARQMPDYSSVQSSSELRGLAKAAIFGNLYSPCYGYADVEHMLWRHIVRMSQSA